MEPAMQMSPPLSGQVKNMHRIESLINREIGKKVSPAKKKKTKAIRGGQK